MSISQMNEENRCVRIREINNVNDDTDYDGDEDYGVNHFQHVYLFNWLIVFQLCANKCVLLSFRSIITISRSLGEEESNPRLARIIKLCRTQSTHTHMNTIKLSLNCSNDRASK